MNLIVDSCKKHVATKIINITYTRVEMQIVVTISSDFLTFFTFWLLSADLSPVLVVGFVSLSSLYSPTTIFECLLYTELYFYWAFTS